MPNSSRTLYLSTPIALLIATILAIVVFSYRQTIHAYPNGGGAYIVRKKTWASFPRWWPRRRC